MAEFCALSCTRPLAVGCDTLVRLLRLVRSGCLVFCVSFACVAAFAAESPSQAPVPSTSITGRTTTLGGSVLLPGVTIVVTGDAGGVAATLQSDERGSFTILGLPPGTFTITASLPGFDDVSKAGIRLAAGAQVRLDVDLPIPGVKESVVVSTRRPTDLPLEIPKTGTSVEVVEGELADTAPLRGETFEGLLPLLPGVVRGPDGRLNVKGGQATQTSVLVNSVNVTDPVTGNFGFTLPIDAVDTVTLFPNPYAAEYGRFTAGVSNVSTRRGTNRWEFTLNNFLPKLRYRDGDIRGIESFTPRLALGGPLVADRLFLAQSFRYRIVKTKIPARPEIENDDRVESFDSFTQLDASLSSRHNLTVTFSLFPRDVEHINLNTFNRREVTPSFRQRGFNVAASERATLSDAALLESSFAFKQFDADIGAQGEQPMAFEPETRSGHFFNEQERDTETMQVVENLMAQRRGWLGDHVFRTGIDLLYSAFHGRSLSRPVEIRRADGVLSQRLTYGAASRQQASSLDIGLFAQDRWRLNDRWLFELGLRADHDGVFERFNVAPRAGAVLGIWPSGDGVLRGGAGMFFNQTPLNVKAFESYETSSLTLFARDGVTVAGLPMTFGHQLAARQTASSFIWNLEYDHRLSDQILLKVNHLRRSGNHEPVVDVVPDAPRSLLRVDGSGRSRYWELELTSRVVAGKQAMNFTYVRSRAQADLNAYDEFFGNFRNPIVRPNEFSLTESDTPHRFLFRGAFSLGAWGLSPVLEARQGFPYSLVDEDQQFVGPRNRGGRFPNAWIFDVDVQRRIKVGKLRPRIGVRVFHLFDNFVPRDVQNNVDAASFGRFSNSIERRFGFTFQID